MVVWYLDICEWYWQGLDGGDGAGALHCIVLFYVVMVQAWMVVMVLARFPCRAVLCGGGDCINLFY